MVEHPPQKCLPLIAKRERIADKASSTEAPPCGDVVHRTLSSRFVRLRMAYHRNHNRESAPARRIPAENHRKEQSVAVASVAESSLRLLPTLRQYRSGCRASRGGDIRLKCSMGSINAQT
jgi:hypothetical protein